MRNTMPTGPIIGLYGFADASNLTLTYTFSPAIGVFGRAYTTSYSSPGFNAGVAGIAYYYGGIGVYGAIYPGYSFSFPTTSPGTYAGYFAGGVNVTGTLTAAAVTTTCDSRLKEDISNLNDSVTNNIQLLRPVEYKFKPDSVHYTYNKDAFEMKISHYGLLAQEVQKIFPNLVYESGDGYLSINYIELIPLLVKSVQELSNEVEILKSEMQKVKNAQ